MTGHSRRPIGCGGALARHGEGDTTLSRSRRSTFAKKVGVELGLGLAERRVRGASAKLLLTVATGGTLHDVDGLEVEVADIGIGWIVSQPDALEEVNVVKGLAISLALQTQETVRLRGQGLPTPLLSVSVGGLRTADFLRKP